MKRIDEAFLKAISGQLLRTDPAVCRALATGTQFSIETGGRTDGPNTIVATLCGMRFTGTLSVDRASGAITQIREGDPGATGQVSDVTARAFDALIRGCAGPESEFYGFTAHGALETAPATAAAEMAHRRIDALEGAEAVAAELRRTGNDGLAEAVLAQAKEAWL